MKRGVFYEGMLDEDYILAENFYQHELNVLEEENEHTRRMQAEARSRMRSNNMM